MKFGSLPEEPDSQVTKEVGKPGHVSRFEPAFGSAISCKIESFLITTNPEQPLYLRPSASQELGSPIAQVSPSHQAPGLALENLPLSLQLFFFQKSWGFMSHQKKNNN